MKLTFRKSSNNARHIAERTAGKSFGGNERKMTINPWKSSHIGGTLGTADDRVMSRHGVKS